MAGQQMVSSGSTKGVTCATCSRRVEEALPKAGCLAEGGSQPSSLTEGLKHGSLLSWSEVAG